MQWNTLDPRWLMAVGAVVVVLIVGIALYAQQRRKTTTRLRTRFGSEYEGAVVAEGSARKAEARLAERETRVEKLKLRDLGTVERDRFSAEWRTVQSRFVDHPKSAVIEADELISSLMQARGYPVSDFDQRAADISVLHPRLVENYRSAHGAAGRTEAGEAGTEELRKAMLDYRSLFEELMQERVPGEIRGSAGL